MDRNIYIGRNIIEIRNEQANQLISNAGKKAEWDKIKHQILPEFESSIKRYTADSQAGKKLSRGDPRYRVVGLRVIIHLFINPQNKL